MANTTAELTWLAFILKDLRITLSSPPILYCDNLSALHMTVNPVFHARSKHIELDYHFVRERVARGLLVTQHISSVNQVADLFTKPMSKAALQYFRNKLCLQPRQSLREGVNHLLQLDTVGTANNCESQWRNKDTRDSWRKKGGDSHNLASITGERLSDLGALTAIFSNQDDNPIKPITSASSNLQ